MQKEIILKAVFIFSISLCYQICEGVQGKGCQETNDCNKQNSKSNLICDEKKVCACHKDQVWNLHESVCVAFYGQRCIMDRPGTDQCVDHSECVKDPNSLGKLGRCMCKSGYNLIEENNTKYCVSKSDNKEAASQSAPASAASSRRFESSFSTSSKLSSSSSALLLFILPIIHYM